MLLSQDTRTASAATQPRANLHLNQKCLQAFPERGNITEMRSRQQITPFDRDSVRSNNISVIPTLI